MNRDIRCVNMSFKDQPMTFTGDNIILDGCSFENCTLTLDGQVSGLITNCYFKNAPIISKDNLSIMNSTFENGGIQFMVSDPMLYNIFLIKNSDGRDCNILNNGPLAI